MNTRTCEGCGTSIALYRSQARTCSPACRKRVSRMRRFPKEMTENRRWVRRTSTKRPITTAGRSASSTNRETWTDYASASSCTKGAGLGYVLGDGVGCIDLDHCIDGGVLADWARRILDQCPLTFVEISQSGHGLHIFGFIPERAGRNRREGVEAVEVYSIGRYIAVTGDRFEGSPVKLADLSEVAARIV